MLVLTDADVKAAIDIPEAVRVNREAFISLSSKDAQVPIRIVLSQETNPRVDTLFKPALVGEGCGLKVVTSAPGNAALPTPIPTIQGTILLVHHRTGVATAVMNANYLTALRTAAGSGAATEILASRDAKVLTIFGAGAQGDLHARTMLHVRPSIKTVYVWNRTPARAVQLVEELRKDYPKITVQTVDASDNAAVSAAVQAADIICTCTGSATPVFNGTDLRPGTHLNCIGSYRPDMQEVDEKTVLACDLLTADDHASTTVKSGDFANPIANGTLQADKVVEIGHALKDTDKYTEYLGKTTLFKSVGVAVQDVATAQAVYQVALARGLGQKIDL